jgi:hypothetical protein
LLDHILAEGELTDYLPELKELLPHVPVVLFPGFEVQQQINARRFFGALLYRHR